MTKFGKTAALLLCLNLGLGGCSEDNKQSANNTSSVGVKLNDTGVTACADSLSNNTICSSPTNAALPNQDAEFGRDLTLNDDINGHAGFDFTKISANGAALASTETEWTCVEDNVTGLTWETKTPYQTPTSITPPTLNLRANFYTYSWYSPSSSTNNVLFGHYNGGRCFGSSAESCDTYGYINSINKLALCGYRDWRLPSKEELRSIVDYSQRGITIDRNYFPHTSQASPPSQDFLWYWTAEHYAANLNFAWQINFNHGGDGREYKYAPKLIRLVRGN